MKQPYLLNSLIAWSVLDIILICFGNTITIILAAILLFILIINWRDYLNTNYK